MTLVEGIGEVDEEFFGTAHGEAVHGHEDAHGLVERVIEREGLVGDDGPIEGFGVGAGGGTEGDLFGGRRGELADHGGNGGGIALGREARTGRRKVFGDAAD